MPETLEKTQEEMDVLKAEHKRMRDALVAIFATGPINSSGRGVRHPYKALFFKNLITARRGLGVPKLGDGSHQAAWNWIYDQGWMEP
jgi:hypothetical protein